MSSSPQFRAHGTLHDGTVVANYVISRCVGAGAMGEVYEAVHQTLDKRVAIKTLFNRGSEDLANRFVREGKAAARIRHPNVVDVFDAGVHDGIPYLIMEFLEGEDLAARLERVERLSPHETADLFLPLLAGLQAAHGAGVIHRDLKPDNIVLTEQPPHGEVPKVVDFGISKMGEGELQLTATNDLLGTPYYMSPEQVTNSRDVDARSVLFAVGVILYRCVSGRHPFVGESLYQVIHAITHETPAPPARDGELPPAFLHVVYRSLEKKPENRFQTPAEFARAMLPFASPRMQTLYGPEFDGPNPFADPHNLQSGYGYEQRSSRGSDASKGVFYSGVRRSPSQHPAAHRGRGALLLALGVAVGLAGAFWFGQRDAGSIDSDAPHIAQPAASATSATPPTPQAAPAQQANAPASTTASEDRSSPGQAHSATVPTIPSADSSAPGAGTVSASDLTPATAAQSAAPPSANADTDDPELNVDPSATRPTGRSNKRPADSRADRRPAGADPRRGGPTGTRANSGRRQTTATTARGLNTAAPTAPAGATGATATPVSGGTAAPPDEQIPKANTDPDYLLRDRN